MDLAPWYSLVNNLAKFFLCSGNLSEAKLKSNGLICLVEKILREKSTQAVAWLLVSAFTEVDRERTQETEQKDKGENVQFGKEKNGN